MRKRKARVRETVIKNRKKRQRDCRNWHTKRQNIKDTEFGIVEHSCKD